MSANYTCNQFDKAYKPTRLGNWEVPKWHLNRPKGRSTVTKVIANDKGHLLPGVQKSDQKHWAGLYLGTYQLPKRISKDTAIELSSPKCQTWMKRSYHHPFIDRGQRRKSKNDNKLENIKCAKQRPDETDRDSIKSVKSAISNVRPANRSSFETVRNCASADGALNSTDDGGGRGSRGRLSVVGAGCGGCAKTPSSPALSRISASGDADGDADDDSRRHHHRHHQHHQRHKHHRGDRHTQQEAAAEVADEPAEHEPAVVTPPGRRHGDAHRHHALPDTIEDAVYRSLQTKRQKHPGLGLDGCWPKCSAVAYKSFNDPGPTQCSKLRVYRPKTSSPAGEKKDGVAMRRCGGCRNGSPRPKTCVPVFTAQELTDIKLALCWDLDAPFDRNRRQRPADEPSVFHKVKPQQEQQQSPGESSGGSAGGGSAGGGGAPRKSQNSSAVMGFVRAPKAENSGGEGKFVPESKRSQTRECLLKNRNLSAVMELIPNKEPRGDGNGNGDRSRAEAAVERNECGSSNNRSLSSPSSSRGGCKSGSVADDGYCKSSSAAAVAKDLQQHGYYRGNRTSLQDDGKPDGTANDDGGGSCDECARLPRSSSGRSSERRRRPHRRAHRRRHHDEAAEKERQQQRHAYRPCVACDNPDAACNGGKKDECGGGDHYKMAFKAGVPISTPVKHRAAAAGQPAKLLKVPKPRTTNSDKKKYVIGTLLPPFSMWPGTTARDYPEHWRLTSVYRQAFKPLELRKQPLLQTVYL